MADGDRLQDFAGPSGRDGDRRRAWRESVYIAVAAVVAVGAGILGLWVSSTASIRQNYHHYLIGMAEAAAQQVDPSLHQTMRDPAASLELMRQLQAIGVSMAMDDFGTGTSSLACLRE